MTMAGVTSKNGGPWGALHVVEVRAARASQNSRSFPAKTCFAHDRRKTDFSNTCFAHDRRRTDFLTRRSAPNVAAGPKPQATVHKGEENALTRHENVAARALAWREAGAGMF
ncbi:uncharacterized protein LOC118644696 [Monomorium pharaonis]|uniref:uncharacterized protein LOC118644696 n=1 Tax=Monomorium pharaonis TaxID=307658 RepID=UPI001747D53B|nr:uncharacterized protein LOC118644696 [Monomorium pharaonis]